MEHLVQKKKTSENSLLSRIRPKNKYVREAFIYVFDITLFVHDAVRHDHDHT